MDGDPEPTLSICVPTFDRADLVRRAIGSVVASAAGHEAEVEVVVSDNSPDRTEAACRSALTGWSGRQQYLANRPDIGIVANFNQCVARSRGRFVLFVHDDDRVLPGAVPAILRAIGRGGPDDAVLLFGVDVVDDRGRPIHRQRFRMEARIAPADAVHRLLSDNGLAWFPGLVIRRDAFEEVGSFEPAAGNATDLDLWVRLFARFGLRCLPDAISAYTVHAGSATHQMAFDREAIDRLARIFDRARGLGILPTRAIDRCQVRYVHQVILGAAFVDLRSGERAAARQVMAVLDLPEVMALGRAPEWRFVRHVGMALSWLPTPLVRPIVDAADRLDVGRRLRSRASRKRGLLPLA